MTALVVTTLCRLRLPALCLAALFTLTTADAAPLWKWRDANGRVQISDRPPPKEVPDSAIIQRPDAAAAINYSPAAVPPGDVTPVGRGRGASAAAEAGAVDPELEKRRRQIQADAQKNPAPPAAPKVDPQAAAQRAESCRRAQNLLAALQSGQRMARAGAQGEREVLDDKARAEEVRRAQEQILSSCR